ncbi:MAG: phage holin family protein [Flavobacteriaceae bacterium]|nr:phage holin family protein [Candidatus Onthonaster equi]
MKSLIIKLIVSASILLIGDYLFESITIDGFLYALILVILLGFLNATVKPIIKLFSLPITILTLGLFNFVITVLILKLADVLMGTYFETDGFLPTLGFAIVITVLNSFADLFISDKN